MHCIARIAAYCRAAVSSALQQHASNANGPSYIVIPGIGRTPRHRSRHRQSLEAPPDLAEPLRLLLQQVAKTDAPAEPLPDLAGLVRRLGAVEQRVAEHDALLALQPALQVPAMVAALAGALPALPAPAVHAEGPTRPGRASKAPAKPWTIGEGKQRRLSPAGLAELDRRLRAGGPDGAIAAALGVSPQTVAKRGAGNKSGGAS